VLVVPFCYTTNPALQYTLDSAGEGVDIYIFDTGVRISHNFFLNWDGPSWPSGTSRASHFQNMQFSKYVNDTMVIFSELSPNVSLIFLVG
jgi:hypothetical protein